MECESGHNGACERTKTCEIDKLDERASTVNGIVKVEDVASRNGLSSDGIASRTNHRNSEYDKTTVESNSQLEHNSQRDECDLVNTAEDGLSMSCTDLAGHVSKASNVNNLSSTNKFLSDQFDNAERLNDPEVCDNDFDSSEEHNFPQVQVISHLDSDGVGLETNDITDVFTSMPVPIVRSASGLTVRSASVSSDIFTTGTSEREALEDMESGAVSDSEASGPSYHGRKAVQRPQRPVPFSVSSRTRFHSHARIQIPRRRVAHSRSLPESAILCRQRAPARDNAVQGRELLIPSGNIIEGNTDDEDDNDDDERILGLCSLSGADKMILLCLALVDLSSQMCLSIMAPFFPTEADSKGVSSTVSGWIFGVFALVQVVTSPLVARLILPLGSRFLISAGQFFAGGCIILFGLMDYVEGTKGDNTAFVVLCFVLRICLALGCTAASTASFAVTANCFPERVSTVFGLLEAATGVGMMVGPALGGVLYQLGGFITPFGVLGSFMILSVPVNMYFLPKEDENRPSTQPVSLLQIVRIPSILIVCFTVVMSAMVWSVMDPTLAPHLTEFNLNPSILGLLFLLMSAFYAVFSPLWGWIADKMVNSLPMIGAGFLLTGFGLLLLGPSPILGFSQSKNTLWLNIVALGILGVSVSLAIVPTFDKILDAVERAGIEDSFGMYSYVAGLWGGSYALGEFIGPSVGGMLMDSTGFPWMMTYIGISCFILAVLLFIYSAVERYHQSVLNKRAEITENYSQEQAPTERTPLLTSITVAANA